MRVFHGSAVEVTNPEIRTGKFTKDFGEGFYCTKLKRQAKRWAMRKETPTITTYEYTPDKTLSILDFKGMTDAWLDFIVDCRKGLPHNYDIVIGAMANDQIYNYIEDFIAEVEEVVMSFKFASCHFLLSFSDSTNFKHFRDASVAKHI